jgi:cysteine-rich repeat protein
MGVCNGIFTTVYSTVPSKSSLEPSLTLCTAGTVGNFVYNPITYTYTWTCDGINGTDDSCTATTLYCGDGILDTLEQCDDGNTVDGDGCSAICETEIPPENGVCGGAKR